MEIIITAVLNSVAYQHKTQAESVIPEPELRPSNLSYLRHFPKDTEADKNSFGIGIRHIGPKTSVKRYLPLGPKISSSIRRGAGRL